MVEAEPVVEMMGDTVTAGEDIVGDIAEDIAVGAAAAEAMEEAGVVEVVAGVETECC